MGKRNTGRYPAHLLCRHCGTGVMEHARSISIMEGNVKHIYHDVCYRKARKVERQRARRNAAVLDVARKELRAEQQAATPPPAPPPAAAPSVAALAQELLPPVRPVFLPAAGLRTPDAMMDRQRHAVACPSCPLGRTRRYLKADGWHIRACGDHHWFITAGALGTPLRAEDAKRVIAWARATRGTKRHRPCPLCAVALERAAVAAHIATAHAMPRARTKQVSIGDPDASPIARSENGARAEAGAAVSSTGFSVEHLERFVENGKAAQAAVDALTPSPDLDDALLNADVALKTLWQVMLAEFRREMAALLDARLPR